MASLQSAAVSPVVRIQRNKCAIFCCSAASSVANPGAAFPERERIKQKIKKKIAGIDQTTLLDPWLLADPNSRFAEYNGIQVHYKISSDSRTSSAAYPMILLHGFGASVFSWERIMEPLSRLLSTTVVAFDRPGFGLTSRLVPNTGEENPYSLDFSAAISLGFINFLKADKAILIGHSAGCIVAADAYFRSPDRIAAIIMLAPAIAAPLFVKKQKASNISKQDTPESSQPTGNAVLSFIATLFLRLRFVLVSICSEFVKLARNIRIFAIALYCKLLSAALRSRLAISMIQWVMDKYADKVVRNAWYDPEKADNYVIQGYKKPLGCRHWDRALLEYVIALVASRNEGKKLGDKLPEISCPVLVVTGDTDRLVPGWNAERLAKVFPKSKFHMIKQCGHLPHEEKPEEVINTIKEFISAI